MLSNRNKEHLLKMLSQYSGFVFRWQIYTQASEVWTHDHCSGCWARFAERPWDQDTLTEGWLTLWPVDNSPSKDDDTIAQFRSKGYIAVPSPKLHGFQRDWLCPNCFETVREELGFVVDPDHPQWRLAGL